MSSTMIPESNTDLMIAAEDQWLDHKYVQDLELECPCCLNVTQSLVSLPCGHTICMDCGRQTLKLECPVDRTPLTRQQLTTECKFKTRKAQATRIRCRRVECQWQGELRQQPEHEEQCPECLVRCECGQEMVRKVLRLHQKQVCTERKIVCRHCRLHVLHRVFIDHTNQRCVAKPVRCPLQCDTDQDLKVAHLAEHLAHHCPLRPVSCEFCHEEVRWSELYGELNVHDCKAKPQHCPQCKIQLPQVSLPRHVEQECFKRTVPCPLNCTSVIRFDELNRHLQLSCANRIIRCSYGQSLQCMMQGTPTEVALHELHDSSLHLCSAMERLTTAQTELDAFKQRDKWLAGTWIMALDSSAVWNHAQIVERLNNELVNIVYHSGSCVALPPNKTQSEMISIHSFRLAPWDSKPLGMQERLLKGCIRPAIHIALT